MRRRRLDLLTGESGFVRTAKFNRPGWNQCRPKNYFSAKIFVLLRIFAADFV